MDASKMESKHAYEAKLDPSDSTPRLGLVSENNDNLHRRITNRQLQLLAIGGAIGTALSVSIGNGLAAGGPASLLIAYILWSFVVAAVNNSITEMVVYQHVSGGFIRIAGHWFDDALGFMVGWNFFFFELLAILFEIAAVNLSASYSTGTHIVNALLITSIFSAGNTYVYCGTRTLYGMALEGRAPKIFAKTTKNGVPWPAFCVCISFGFLSFLQVRNSSAQVISWLISLITGCCMIDYFTMAITFINYHKACKAQGVDRKTMPYTGWLQPGCAYVAAVATLFVAIFLGYGAFQPWSVAYFFQSYTMQLIAPVLYLGWRFIKKTKYVKPAELDLVWEAPIVDVYEESFTAPPTGFWLEMGQLIGIKRHIRDDVRRPSLVIG